MRYYHVTPARNLDSIALRGLVPHRNDQWGVTATFVEDSREEAEVYASADTATLALDLGFSLVYDDEIPEYLVFETVPPDRISVCVGDSFIPIAQHAAPAARSAP